MIRKLALTKAQLRRVFVAGDDDTWRRLVEGRGESYHAFQPRWERVPLDPGRPDVPEAWLVRLERDGVESWEICDYVGDPRRWIQKPKRRSAGRRVKPARGV